MILDEVHAGRGHQAGRPPRAHPGAARRAAARTGPPHRPVGDGAPVDEVARFLAARAPRSRSSSRRVGKEFDLSVVVPVEDLGELGERPRRRRRRGAPSGPSIWPHVEERIADLVQSHRSDDRLRQLPAPGRAALRSRLNEIAYERATGEPAGRAPRARRRADGAGRAPPRALRPCWPGRTTARSREEQRALVEEDLKAGRLLAVVATSSLELGIDMGAVDLVVQVESPPAPCASGLQRVGRAGHQVGAVSPGVVFPKYRGDLVAFGRGHRADARPARSSALRYPRQPARRAGPADRGDGRARRPGSVDDLLATGPQGRAASPRCPSRPAPPCWTCSPGRYPSDAFAELRPRVVWDRVAGALTRPARGRSGSPSPAGGTIPDRGLFGVFLAGRKGRRPGRRAGRGDGVRVPRGGRLHCSARRPGGSRTSRHDRVLGLPGAGGAGHGCRSGRATSWGRPLELGRALGAFVREVRCPRPRRTPGLRLRHRGLGRLGRWTTCCRTSTSSARPCGHVPDDRTIVVERFRDELGDWRVVVHSPFGAQVNAPWALALGARLRERYGDGRRRRLRADDGIVLRLPGRRPEPDLLPRPAGAVLVRPREGGFARSSEIGGHRAGGRLGAVRVRFRRVRAPARCCCPRRSPGRRTPLWQQRQRAAQLLEVASEYGTFPDRPGGRPRSASRTSSTCPACVELMARPASARKVRLVEVDHARGRRRSPRSLLFGYVAQFLYEGDCTARRAPGRRPVARLAACWPSCSGRRSCASCSTRRCSPSWSASCSGSPRTAASRILERRRRPAAGARPADGRRAGRAGRGAAVGA